MSRELKESMRLMSYQIQNISTDRNYKVNQIEILKI